MSKIFYCVIFHPRSGSSWLSKMLAANEGVLDAFELLDIETARNMAFLGSEAPQSARDQFGIVRRFIEHAESRPEIFAAGFKAAPYQMLNAAAFVNQLREWKIKIITLHRNDIVASAISQIGARELHARTGSANLERPSRVVRPFSIERELFRYFLIEQKLERDRVKSIAEVLKGSGAISLTFEDLILNPGEQFDRVSGYLGAKLDRMEDVGIYRNLSDNLDGIVLNISDVRKWAVEFGFDSM